MIATGSPDNLTRRAILLALLRQQREAIRRFRDLRGAEKVAAAKELVAIRPAIVGMGPSQ